MTNAPLVTVLLPVYNGQQYIISAADSILRQDYHSFELLIINDGSTDDTDTLIKQQLLNDPRVRYVSRENKGLIATLNEGIALAKGDYIARMDADDIAHSTRLSRQVTFLQRHPDVAVVGTAYNIINSNDERTGVRHPPLWHCLITPMFIFGSPIAHPAVMLNKKLAEADLFYDKDYIHAEDYELWLRLSLKYKLANVAAICLDYRVLPQSISRRYAKEQRQSVIKAQLAHLYLSDTNTQKLADSAAVLLRYNVACWWQQMVAFCNVVRHRKAPFSRGIALIYLLRNMLR